MFKEKFSQTQLSNFATAAGLVVLISNQFGWVLDQSSVAFIIASLWSLGFSAYNYWQRYRRGDVSLGGQRK
jgi:hypothetical protein